MIRYGKKFPKNIFFSPILVLVTIILFAIEIMNEQWSISSEAFEKEQKVKEWKIIQ